MRTEAQLVATVCLPVPKLWGAPQLSFSPWTYLVPQEIKADTWPDGISICNYISELNIGFDTLV